MLAPSNAIPDAGLECRCYEAEAFGSVVKLALATPSLALDSIECRHSLQ
jgi:hypothetical protein